MPGLADTNFGGSNRFGSRYVDTNRAYQERVIKEYAKRNITLMASLSINDVADIGVRSSVTSELEGLRTMGPFVRQEVAARRGQMQRRMAKVADNAQRAMLARYDSTGKGSPDYRRNAGRYSGGILRKALNRDDFFIATPDGVSFGLIQVLDEIAPHWYRMNYGAGQAAGRRAKNWTVRLFGGDTVTFGLGGNPPSRAFTIYDGAQRGRGGYWKKGPGISGQFNQYFPGKPSKDAIKSKQARFQPYGPTQGIRARHFMDEATRVLARDMPREIEEHFTLILSNAAKRKPYAADVAARSGVTKRTAERKLSKFTNQMKAELKKAGY